MTPRRTRLSYSPSVSAQAGSWGAWLAFHSHQASPHGLLAQRERAGRQLGEQGHRVRRTRLSSKGCSPSVSARSHSAATSPCWYASRRTPLPAHMHSSAVQFHWKWMGACI